MAPLTALELEALGLSLTVALWSVIGSLPVGLGVAWLLARREFWGKTVLNGFVHLPLVLPPVAVGYFLLVALGRRGLVGGWLYDTFGVSVAFTWKGAAIAAAVMAFPLMVRAIRLSLENVEQGLETAARTLGAGRLSVFLRITLPLTMPGILAGSVLAFARALGEFGATITFVSNIPGETRTLPIALYSVIQSPGGEDAALRLLLLSVVLAIAALAVSELLSRRVAGRASLEHRP
jgi:molybdate transport system permease protein